MKGKIEVTELRVEELAAELSKKTEEVQLFKVIHIDTSFLKEHLCLYRSLMQLTGNVRPK